MNLTDLPSGSTVPQIPVKKASKLARALHFDFGSKSKDKKAELRKIYATFTLDDVEGEKPTSAPLAANGPAESKRCDLSEKEVWIDL